MQVTTCHTWSFHREWLQEIYRVIAYSLKQSRFGFIVSPKFIERESVCRIR